VRDERLASAWQKIVRQFSRVLEQHSHNDEASSMSVAFGETSISTCNDDRPHKEPLRWATPQTSTRMTG